MHKRKQKYLTIVALLLIILFLSVGFATFSSVLTIQAHVTMNPTEDNFKVVFTDNESNTDPVGDLEVIPQGLSFNSSADNAIINGTSFNADNIVFSDTSQSVIYDFYVLNMGKYNAFLTNIEINNNTCTPIEETNINMVQEACDDIIVTVTFGNEDPITYNQSTTISNHILAKGEIEPIRVTITYTDDGDIADGPFAIELGQINLTYRTIDSNPDEIELYR